MNSCCLDVTQCLVLCSSSPKGLAHLDTDSNTAKILFSQWKEQSEIAKGSTSPPAIGGIGTANCLGFEGTYICVRLLGTAPSPSSTAFPGATFGGTGKGAHCQSVPHVSKPRERSLFEPIFPFPEGTSGSEQVSSLSLSTRVSPLRPGE